jgi:hypothetical protein
LNHFIYCLVTGTQTVAAVQNEKEMSPTNEFTPENGDSPKLNDDSARALSSFSGEKASNGQSEKVATNDQVNEAVESAAISVFFGSPTNNLMREGDRKMHLA